MPTYYGIVRGNVIVLPEGVQLVEGQTVEVRVPAPESAQPGTPRPEDLLKKRLVEAGLIAESEPSSPTLPSDDWTPIRMEGKPLSEYVIEDRR